MKIFNLELGVQLSQNGQTSPRSPNVGSIPDGMAALVTRQCRPDGLLSRMIFFSTRTLTLNYRAAEADVVVTQGEEAEGDRANPQEWSPTAPTPVAELSNRSHPGPDDEPFHHSIFYHPLVIFSQKIPTLTTPRIYCFAAYIIGLP